MHARRTMLFPVKEIYHPGAFPVNLARSAAVKIGSERANNQALTADGITHYTVSCMDTVRAAYDELYLYALTRPGFVLQHVVDAFAVQCASPESKAISVTFGLVGLYLHVERHFSGRQVQRVHMQLASPRRQWTPADLPATRGEFTVFEVLRAEAGTERDEAIDAWCRSVWGSLSDVRSSVIELLEEHNIFSER